jgi:hypothetical protein
MARKVSEKFRCPRCSAVLTKSPMAVIIGGAGGFIGFGSMPSFITCPSCGGPIETDAMIRGDFDVHEPSGWATLAVLGLLAGGTALLHSRADLGLVPSFIVTLVALFAAEWGFSKIRKAAARRS